MIINGKPVKQMTIYACRLDTATGKRTRCTDWRVTVQFMDGSQWNDGGHSSKKAAANYAKSYAR